MKSVLQFSASQPIAFSNQDTLQTTIHRIEQQIKRHGYCIVQSSDTSVSPLLKIRQALGRAQLHVRADLDGVATISPQASPSIHSIDESKYFGTTNHSHPPHTDGAYLNGFLQQDGELKRVEPPAIVLLQCAQPALKGGSNIVIDGRRILIDLLTHEPEVAQILSKRGCVSFCRDDQMAVDVAVFEWITADRLRVRFRNDDALFYPLWAQEAIQHLQTYVMNEKYRKRIELKEGQILILDNFRILHGRDTFDTESAESSEQSRLFRRAWVHYENEYNILVNFSSKPSHCRAFDRYVPYSVMESSPSNITPHSGIGIGLPNHLRMAMNSGREYHFLNRAG